MGLWCQGFRVVLVLVEAVLQRLFETVAKRYARTQLVVSLTSEPLEDLELSGEKGVCGLILASRHFTMLWDDCGWCRTVDVRVWQVRHQVASAIKILIALVLPLAISISVV